jgi:uncharacterized glyoxalase superfamily protein PhnB
MKNRSVPVDVVLPHLVYGDVGAAIAWLSRAFGFVEQFRYGPPDSPEGAQGRVGGAWMMLTKAREGRASPASAGCWTQMLTVFVEDVEGMLSRARGAGARAVEELNETFYGERQCVVEDLEGHRWMFSRHVRDVDPGTWAMVAGGMK